MAYFALYRKYRPRAFSDVVGQEHITETLKRQVATGRTSHAYLFVGTRGTGKTTCAKILSRALNCERPVDGDPCNACPSCRGIEDGSILDVVEIDAASNNGVDNIRALRDEAVYSPASVKKRVYIIDEVHMLSGSAFNALLKILEEPPEHLVFILATTERQKIPATILSRCQQFSFRRLDPEVIRQRLLFVAEKEGFTLTDGASSMLARLADGSMRDGLSLLDQCVREGTVDERDVTESLGLVGVRDVAELWRAAASGDAGGALKLFERSYRGGADPGSVLTDLLGLVRDMLLIRIAPDGGGALLTGAVGAGELSELSSGLTLPRLLGASELLQEALTAISAARDRRTAAEVCLVKLSGALSGTFTAERPAVEDRAPAPMKKDRPSEAPAGKKSPPPRKDEPPAPWDDAPPPVRDESPPPWNDAPPPARNEAPPPWDDAPPPVRNDAPPPWDDAPPPARDEAQKSAATDDGWWERTLEKLRGYVDGREAMFLTSPGNVEPELAGARLILHVTNQFVSSMIGTPEMLSAVTRAASEALGRDVNVALSGAAQNKELKTERLRELKRFGDIVKFK